MDIIFTRLSHFGTVPLPIVVAIDVDEPDNPIELDGVSKNYAAKHKYTHSHNGWIKRKGYK